jgi:FHS family L-fucose permease-like MFS transporter
MAIMGGAIMPKLMGHIADTSKDGMSAGFIVPLVCFVFVALYGFSWSQLSGTGGVVGTDVRRGH